MISCKEVSVLVSKSLDERLDWRERVQVRLHLFICKACANFVRQMRVLRLATRRVAEGRKSAPLDARLSDQARRRIEETLHNCQHLDDSR